MQNICPVCGYPDLDEPAYADGYYSSDEICSSCGYQFGWTDDDLGISHEEWRKKWIAEGMIWYDDTEHGIKPPVGWNPVAQLRNINVFVE